MQKALASQRLSVNDCFADDAVEDAEKKLIPHCCQCSSEDERFATYSLLTTLICWEALKEISNNSLKD